MPPLLLAHLQPLSRALAIDAALDFEQGVDAPDRLQRDRRNRSRLVAAPHIGRDVVAARGPSTAQIAGPSDLCHSRGMPPHTFEDAGGGQFAEQAHDLGG